MQFLESKISSKIIIDIITLRFIKAKQKIEKVKQKIDKSKTED